MDIQSMKPTRSRGLFSTMADNDSLSSCGYPCEANPTEWTEADNRGPLLEEPYKSIIFFVLLPLLATGFCINLAIIVMFLRNIMVVYSSTNILVLNLTVSDLLITVVPIPVMMASVWKGEWLLSEDGCRLYAFSFLCFSSLSGFSTTAIAVERYYSLTVPQQLNGRDTRLKFAGRMVCIVWMTSVGVSLPPFLGWSGVHLDPSKLVCGLEWRKDEFPYMIYPAFYTALCIFAPVIVKTIFYYQLCVKIYTVSDASRHTRRTSSVARFALRVSRVSRNSSTGSRNSTTSALTNSINSNLQSLEKQATRGKKLVVSMALMVGVSFVTWCPFGIASTVLAATDVSPEWIVPTVILAKTCVLYNPLFYLAFNKKFRRMFLRTFLCSLNSRRITSASPVDIGAVQSGQRTLAPPSYDQGLYTITEMDSRTALPGSRFEKRLSNNSSATSSVLDRRFQSRTCQEATELKQAAESFDSWGGQARKLALVGPP